MLIVMEDWRGKVGTKEEMVRATKQNIYYKESYS